MDAVYLCRSGENEELRYSIRSTIKNLPHKNIYVVGGKPSWYTGDYVFVAQYPSKKYQNAQNNLKAIIKNRNISDTFILMNDDFFTVKKLKEVPVFHGGPLLKKVEKYKKMAPNSSYTYKLEKTYNWLINNGYENPLDYELHVPMVMEKERLAKCIKPNILWRSLYGNMFNIGGKLIRDVKVYNAGLLVENSYNYSSMRYPYISTEDSAFETLGRDVLFKMFPEPSHLELEFVAGKQYRSFRQSKQEKIALLKQQNSNTTTQGPCNCACSCCRNSVVH